MALSKIRRNNILFLKYSFDLKPNFQVQIGFKQEKPYAAIVSIALSPTKFLHLNSEEFDRLFLFIHSQISEDSTNEGIFVLTSTKHVKFNVIGKGEKTIKSIEIIDMENFVTIKFDCKSFEKMKQISFYLHQVMRSMVLHQELVTSFVEKYLQTCMKHRLLRIENHNFLDEFAQVNTSINLMRLFNEIPLLFSPLLEVSLLFNSNSM